MGESYIGQSLARREDRRLVTGGGQYVSDLVRPHMLQLVAVRSPHAHARVVSYDFRGARALDGVVGVFGPDELRDVLRPFPATMADPRLKSVPPTVVADGVTRYVGEPVAYVAAVNRYVGEDAADLVEIQYEPLPPYVDPREPEVGRILHPEIGTNLAAIVGYQVGEGETAVLEAPVSVPVSLRLSRVVAHPMEPRGIVAEWDEHHETLRVWAGTQGVFGVRAQLAAILGIRPDAVRVVAPDVGGGFGVKNRVYPEDAAAAYLARRLGRPVKWVGDRREEFLSTNQERDQWHEARIGVDRTGRIIGVVDRFVQDNGAYTHSGLIVPNTTAVCLPGPYRVPHMLVEGRVVLTNKVPIGPYRGAGRPQATFVMERLLDAAADALHLDRVEIRRRNLITPEEMPYVTGVPGWGGHPVTYRDGHYPACMEAVAARLPSGPAEPWVGTALANYLEVSAGGGFEGVRLTLLRDGRIRVASGSASQGQGHQVTLAQIAADRLGVPIERVDVLEGDTDAVSRGIGTFGSRTTVVAGNTVAAAAEPFRARCLEAARDLLEADVRDLEWDGRAGRIAVRGVPGRAVSLAQLAETREAAGQAPLAVDGEWSGAQAEYGMGTHGIRLTVDPDTWSVRITDYWICHDTGVMVNPLLVRGQTIGGTVQGMGQALLEALRLDDTGQPQNTTFLDYWIPDATLMPDILMEEQPLRSPTNPEGFKGIAEGGVMPPMAVVLSALEQALAHLGPVRLGSLPVTPAELFDSLRGGSGPAPSRGEGLQ